MDEKSKQAAPAVDHGLQDRREEGPVLGPGLGQRFLISDPAKADFAAGDPRKRELGDLNDLGIRVTAQSPTKSAAEKNRTGLVCARNRCYPRTDDWK